LKKGQSYLSSYIKYTKNLLNSKRTSFIIITDMEEKRKDRSRDIRRPTKTTYNAKKPKRIIKSCTNEKIEREFRVLRWAN
jgi:hypothetical protein